MPELSGLECTNTASSRRGIYVYNGRIIFYSSHHKSRHIVDRDFQVVRTLPHAIATKFFYYFVYIRLVVDFLRRECKLGGGAGNALFSTGSRVMTATDLTQSLRRYSEGVIGQPINYRLYRQLAIAILEKHVPRLLQPFDIHDDTNPYMMLHSVRAWQSGHRPRQRAAYYGHDGALPTSLSPALLEAYIWFSTLWHRFLGLHCSSPWSLVAENEAASPQRKRPLGDNPNLAGHNSLPVFPPSKRTKQPIVTADPNRQREIPTETVGQCPPSVWRSSPGAPQHIVREVGQHPQAECLYSSIFLGP